MSKIEKCPRCGATSPVIQNGNCGNCGGRPMGQEERAGLIEDWNAMVSAVARFSEKHGLPKGEIIFPPAVLDNLRDACDEHLLDTFIVNGIRARFGHFEQADVFRQY